jgi:uncharacterized protein with von Willebrand factor type A (vWA) domain
MKLEELPLLELFNRLREHGLPLGIEEYMAVLRALQAGFGVSDHQALERLCRTTWVKSDEEERLFRRLFGQMLTKPITRPDGTLPPESPQPRPETPAEPPPETPLLEEPKPVPPTTAQRTPRSLTLEIDEPAQIVQAVRLRRGGDLGTRRPSFSLLTEYFPVTRRQMKQSWRHLRRPVREGLLEELDVRATIEKIGREGILLEPVLVPLRSNRAELVLLVDQDGSMVPFHALSRQLIETARRGGRLRRAGVYYFHDYPDEYLYCDPARREAERIPDTLAAIGKRAVLLIISDAGAARGNFDQKRVEQTQAFVQQLKQSVRHYAWLNPMPNNRWPGTTAGEIARFVPMFEISRRGLEAAISTLRGLYVCWEKMYPWMM